MRALTATAVACAALGAAAGCGSEEEQAPVAAPHSGTAYRELSGAERLAAAEACRDRAAGAARGVAADELRRVDPVALRAELDAAFAWIPNQRRGFAGVCGERLPFVTPGWRLRFDGAEHVGDQFTYETTSDRPLTISGVVAPAPRDGRVTVRREFGSREAYRARIEPDGRFTLPAISLRKLANNSFVVRFDAPPGAPRKAYFSALCLDCMAGAPPPQ